MGIISIATAVIACATPLSESSKSDVPSPVTARRPSVTETSTATPACIQTKDRSILRRAGKDSHAQQETGHDDGVAGLLTGSRSSIDLSALTNSGNRSVRTRATDRRASRRASARSATDAASDR